MILPYIELAGALVMLGAWLWYFQWVHLRVWILRQDLFEIRDRLWDEAHKGEFLDDPTYLSARESINIIIRTLPSFNLPMWLYLRNVIRSKPDGQRASRPEIDAAVSAAGHILVRYMYKQTLSGWLYLAFSVVAGEIAGRVDEIGQAEHDAGQIVESEEMRAIDQTYQRMGLGQVLGV